MPARIDSRIQRLERAFPARRMVCSRCQPWQPEVLMEGDPEPSARCSGCGRARPTDLWVVRFVARDDGPQ